MGRLWTEELKDHSDTLRTRAGESVTVRFVEPADAEELQHYFRSLSTHSRYSRFFSAISELPQFLLDQFVQVGDNERFSVVATVPVDGIEIIVGEARYALHEEAGSLEFGISIGDAWQGRGLGSALLKNLECRAAALGARRMFGDTLRSNGAMSALALNSGFALTQHPDDWKLVRFEKQVNADPNEIPCASWRLAAASRAESQATN